MFFSLPIAFFSLFWYQQTIMGKTEREGGEISSQGACEFIPPSFNLSHFSFQLALSLYNNILQAYTILNIGTYLVSNFVLPSLLFSFSSCEYLSFIFCPPKINAFSTWHRYCYISQTLVVWLENGHIILWLRVCSLTWANLSQNYSF